MSIPVNPQSNNNLFDPLLGKLMNIKLPDYQVQKTPYFMSAQNLQQGTQQQIGKPFEQGVVGSTQKALDSVSNVLPIIPAIKQSVQQHTLQRLATMYQQEAHRYAANPTQLALGMISPESEGISKMKDYVDELFNTNPKQLIENHNEKIMLDDTSRISRKSIKYIIDSRKLDGYSSEDIKTMLERSPSVIKNPEIEFANKNPKYPDSRISVKLYPEEKQALMVIHQPDGEIKDIFNSYYRPENKTISLYGKK